MKLFRQATTQGICKGSSLVRQLQKFLWRFRRHWTRSEELKPSTSMKKSASGHFNETWGGGIRPRKPGVASKNPRFQCPQIRLSIVNRIVPSKDDWCLSWSRQKQWPLGGFFVTELPFFWQRDSLWSACLYAEQGLEWHQTRFKDIFVYPPGMIFYGQRSCPSCHLSRTSTRAWQLTLLQLLSSALSATSPKNRSQPPRCHVQGTNRGQPNRGFDSQRLSKVKRRLKGYIDLRKTLARTRGVWPKSVWLTHDFQPEGLSWHRVDESSSNHPQRLGMTRHPPAQNLASSALMACDVRQVHADLWPCIVEFWPWKCGRNNNDVPTMEKKPCLQ